MNSTNYVLVSFIQNRSARHSGLQLTGLAVLHAPHRNGAIVGKRPLLSRVITPIKISGPCFRLISSSADKPPSAKSVKELFDFHPKANQSAQYYQKTSPQNLGCCTVNRWITWGGFERHANDDELLEHDRGKNRFRCNRSQFEEHCFLPFAGRLQFLYHSERRRADSRIRR